MSEKTKGFFVSFGEDLCAEQADAIRIAIEQIKGVISVDKCPSVPSHDWIVEQRVRTEIGKKMKNFISCEIFKA